MTALNMLDEPDMVANPKILDRSDPRRAVAEPARSLKSRPISL